MSFSEVLVLLVCLVLTGVFLIRWYMYVLSARSFNGGGEAKFTLALLPIACFVMVMITLKRWAASDVEGVYVFFYALMGLAWLYAGLILTSMLFDLSWIDDALSLNNKAAVFSTAGSALVITMIFCGANVGEGPGWWCVIFAGGLGLAAWFILLYFINLTAKTTERITVERDACCGVRYFFFCIAAGIILGRASAGDWTSFWDTIIEFGVGWPILPLTALMILIERFYISRGKANPEGKPVLSSLFFGLMYIGLAAGSVALWS